MNTTQTLFDFNQVPQFKSHKELWLENIHLFKSCKEGSDCDIILKYIIDEEWHNTIDAQRTLKPNCINWAFRSRISDLKKKGYFIESRIGENGCAEYQLDILKSIEKAKGETIIKETK